MVAFSAYAHFAAYADASGTPANTGANSSCVSRWGVYDMVWNVWEWTADWAAEFGWNGIASNRPLDKGSDAYWRDLGLASSYPGSGVGFYCCKQKIQNLSGWESGWNKTGQEA